MKKYLILSGLAICGLLVTGVVFAQTTNNYPSFIEKLAERFNLNIEEVQEFFDENRAEFKGGKMGLNRSETSLDNLVEQGKITEEQKQNILEKQEEMKNIMEEFKDLSPEERQEKMQELKENMDQWREENGIDFPMNGGFMGKGPGRGFRDCSDKEE